MKKEILSEGQEKAKIINQVISEHYNTSLSLIWSKSRDPELVFLRQMIHYTIKTYTSLSLANIGRCSIDYGKKKDHATVMHGCKSIRNYIDVNRVKKEEIRFVLEMCRKKLIEFKQKTENLTPEKKRFLSFKMKIYRAIRMSANEEVLKNELVEIL